MQCDRYGEIRRLDDQEISAKIVKLFVLLVKQLRQIFSVQCTTPYVESVRFIHTWKVHDFIRGKCTVLVNADCFPHDIFLQPCRVRALYRPFRGLWLRRNGAPDGDRLSRLHFSLISAKHLELRGQYEATFSLLACEMKRNFYFQRTVKSLPRDFTFSPLTLICLVYNSANDFLSNSYRGNLTLQA